MGQQPSATTVVVIVDDDAVRDALRFSLETEGFKVDAFPTAEAILDRDFSESECCIVLDQTLPGLTGLECLQHLRNRQVDQPAFIMTGAPGKHLHEMADTLNYKIIEKPLLGEKLSQGIRAAKSLGDRRKNCCGS